MKRPTLILLMALGAAGPPGFSATPIYITAEVPTTETATLTTLLPWEIYRYDAGPIYTLELTVPGDPHIDAIHKMDSPGDWLISIEAPNNLAGALGTDAEPRDVVRYDGGSGTYSLFFSGAALGVPLESNVDAVYLDGPDTGDLVVSFDVPTELPAGSGTFYDPADLVAYKPTGGGGPGDWTFSGIVFDASAAGSGVPTSDNLIGADGGTATTVLSMDVPSDLAPSLGPPTYVPGQLASWDGVNFDLFETLVGWPINSLVDGISCLANPGVVPTTILLDKAGGSIVINWTASCADGAEDYGIYEGTIGTWYNHTALICVDSVPLFTETFLPAAASSYYLVVPLNSKEEGSYGQDSNNVERPIGAAVCVTPQTLTPCPP